MASIKTKFSVGLFLLIGMSLAIAGIIWLGLSNYLETGQLYVAYFDESVQGLDVDSPVKYRGVSIGRVQDIGVAPDERLIEVIMKIESEVQPEQQTSDIVAQLKSVGITGLMFIELERSQPSDLDLAPKITFEAPYPVIPTRPSEISKFFQGIEDVFSLFRALDTKTISDQMIQALAKINKAIDASELDSLAADLRVTLGKMQRLMNSEQVSRLLASAEQTSNSMNRLMRNANDGVSDVRRTVNSMDRILQNGSEDMQAIASDLRTATLQVRHAMQSAAALIENTDRNMIALQQQMLTTLARIDQAGQSLNRFLDQVSNQPSQLIFSQPAMEKPTAP